MVVSKIEKIQTKAENMIKKFWNIYCNETLIKKINKKVNDIALVKQALKDINLSDDVYLQNRFQYWQHKKLSKKKIYWKFIEDWYSNKEKLNDFLDKQEEQSEDKVLEYAFNKYNLKEEINNCKAIMNWDHSYEEKMKARKRLDSQIAKFGRYALSKGWNVSEYFDFINKKMK